MTIEEKAKAYDEAIERAKELLEVGLKDTRDKRVVLSFFPELAKSEDEKIREWLIDWANAVNWSKQFPVTKEQVLAWLEKPVEQQMYWTEEEIEPIISDYLCGREHYGGMIGRLCHLKPKQEWSEEDEERYDSCIACIRACSTGDGVDIANIEWFKSIKQRIQKEE